MLGAAYLGRHLLRKRGPIIPLYRRDYEHPVCDHEMREKVYTIVKENPGITPSEICRRLGVKHFNTVKHHLRVLEERDLIVLKRDPVKRRLITCYPVDSPRLEVGYLSDAERYLLEVIRKHPGVRRRDLAQRWPYSQAYLTRCLKSLEIRGAVSKENGGYAPRIY